jgi:signal transduction histidine kinase
MDDILYVLQEGENASAIGSLRRGLEAANGHKLRVAPLDEVMESSSSPDLVLLDIQAADDVFGTMSALAALKAPVVAHTADSNGGVRMHYQALAVGCAGYIPKPAPEDVCERIGAYPNGHRFTLLDRQVQVKALRAIARSAIARLAAEKATLQRCLDAREYWFHATIHELRAAMGWVAAYAALIEDGRGALDGHDLWDEFRAGLAALQHRVEDLEVFSISEMDELPLELERGDLAALARDYALRHRVICDDCTLRTHLSPVTVEMDHGRVTQILENLVNNAHKFTRSCGHRPEIEIRVQREGEWASLEVLDNGPGVPDDQRERIFAPFRRSDSEETRLIPGLGLGLSVVRRIAKAHGGHVECTNKPSGVGSRFVVRLPVHRSAEGSCDTSLEHRLDPDRQPMCS